MILEICLVRMVFTFQLLIQLVCGPSSDSPIQMVYLLLHAPLEVYEMCSSPPNSFVPFGYCTFDNDIGRVNREMEDIGTKLDS